MAELNNALSLEPNGLATAEDGPIWSLSAPKELEQIPTRFRSYATRFLNSKPLDGLLSAGKRSQSDARFVSAEKSNRQLECIH
jgi:hypothetical protein